MCELRMYLYHSAKQHAVTQATVATMFTTKWNQNYKLNYKKTKGHYPFYHSSAQGLGTVVSHCLASHAPAARGS